MFRKAIVVMAFSLLAFDGLAKNADYQVVPLPQSIRLTQEAPFILSSSTPVVYEGTDADMQRQAQFLSDYIKQITGIRTQVLSKRTKARPSIILILNRKLKGSESYKLIVSHKQIIIEGSTSAGVFYGMQTFRKSLPLGGSEKTVTMPTVCITDSPRFSYRGMMLDCGRHFFPINFIKKFIDILALHNMNVFHWHLTEDQGWRIEIKKYPRLTSIGSMRSGTVVGRNSTLDDSIPYGGYYTQDEAKEIVEYARQRHITVIPEIEMPGHMLAALAAYPELGCTGGPYEVAHKWGVFKDVLCLGNEKTYKFLQDIIDEIVHIFPSPYIHIGGDETPTDRWETCPKCRRLAESQGIEPNHLQQYFTNRIEKYSNSKRRRIIGWDEMLKGKIAHSAIIMSWRGIGPGSEAAKLGHDVIMSPTDNDYFDYYQTKNTWNEPLAFGGYLPVSKVYEFEPCPDSLSVEAKKHIIGVQSNLWTEYISTRNQVEYMIMPRIAATSEVQWTAPEKKNYPDFVKRVTRLTALYDCYGYQYAKHLWTEKELKE